GVPWSFWYEVPIGSLAACIIQELGLVEEIKCALLNPDPMGALTSVIKCACEANIELDEASELRESLGSLVMVFQGSISALKAFGATMDELIARVAKGDDEALFDAVLIDRSVTGAPT